jgi:D-alanyl-D-alanine carboxypeptidase
VQAKTGTRGGVTSAGQFLLNASTLAGYADAAGGREVIFTLMVRDVPLSTFADLIAVAEDQAALAAAIQEGY